MSNDPTSAQKPTYYLLKNGYILRLEKELDPEDIPVLIKYNLLDPENILIMNQDQANQRVALFRDEIIEMDEFTEKFFDITL